MRKLIALGLALMLVASLLVGCNGDGTTGGEVDERLVGNWYTGGMPWYTFEADGTGYFMLEAPITWWVRGNSFFVRQETFDGVYETREYTFVYESENERLTLTRDGWDNPFTRTPDGDDGSGWTPPADADPDLAAYMDEIIGDWNEVGLIHTALTEENFRTHTFIDYVPGARGVISQAKAGAIAHMIVLVELPEGVNALEVAADMEANNDPAVWICVAAEVVDILYAGQYVLMVMTTEQLNSPNFETNFNNLFD